MNDLYVLNRIIKKRVKSGFNKSQMAVKLKVSQGTYQKIEAGTSKLTISRLIEIARILNTNPSYFLLSPDENKYPLLTHPDIDTDLKAIVVEQKKDIDTLEKSNDLLEQANSALITLNKQTNHITKACYNMGMGVYETLSMLLNQENEYEGTKLMLQRMGLPVTKDNVTSYLEANSYITQTMRSQISTYKNFLDSMKSLVNSFPSIEDAK